MFIRARGTNWHYRFQFKGKEYTGNTGLQASRRNRKKAQKIGRELMRDLRNGSSNQAIQPVSLKAVIDEFRRLAEPRYRAHPSSFKRINTSLVSATSFFGAKLVREIDAGAIDEYVSWRIVESRVKDITVRHDLYALSRFFATAIRKRWASNNPIREIEIPSDTDAVRIHPLTMHEEEQYFRRAAKHPDLYDVGRLIINQGMRPDEVIRLAKVDIDLPRHLIHIRNGKSSAAKRAIPMTSESKEIIEQRMQTKSNWLFPSSKDSSRPIGKINSAHNRVLAEARKQGLHLAFVPYDLRHTFATRAGQCGMDLPTLASILGHSSIRCLRFYVHPMQDHQRQAMARFEQSQQQLREERLRQSMEPGVIDSA